MTNTQLAMRRLLLLIAATTATASAGTLFIGSYPARVLVLDEASGQIVDRIPLTTGTPMGLRASADLKKIYVTTIDHNGLEVIDVTTRKVVNHFILNTATKQYRFRNGAADPQGKFFYTVIKEIDKLPSRYEISSNKYGVIDIEQHKIIRLVDMPKEDETNPALLGMVLPGSESDANVFEVSPDGKYLYRYGPREIVVLQTEDFKKVDRIDLAKPNLPGIEHVEFGWFLGPDLHVMSQPGEHLTSLYWQDPVVHNKVLGLGRFDLATREITLTPMGAAPQGLYGLQVSPDKSRAYAAISHGPRGDQSCEFWVFDLLRGGVANKANFDCPTHQSFSISTDGKKLYINTKFEIEVYDAATLKHEKTWELKVDSVGAIGAELVAIP
jgi:hypothetical protein